MQCICHCLLCCFFTAGYVSFVDSELLVHEDVGSVEICLELTEVLNATERIVVITVSSRDDTAIGELGI